MCKSKKKKPAKFLNFHVFHPKKNFLNFHVFNPKKTKKGNFPPPKKKQQITKKSSCFLSISTSSYNLQISFQTHLNFTDFYVLLQISFQISTSLPYTSSFQISLQISPSSYNSTNLHRISPISLKKKNSK